MNKRTQELRALMAAHKLNAAEVGELIDRSATTVRIWRCKTAERTIPPHALELLRLKIAARQGDA